MKGRNVTNIDDAAKEFGRHTKSGGGWALGLIVASCVENRQGQRTSDHGRKSKVPASEFARLGHTHERTVQRYLKSWDNAAKDGIVVSAADLIPDNWNDSDHLPVGYEWSVYHRGGERRNPTPTEVRESILNSPDIAEVAARSLNERIERDATFDKPPKMPWDETPNTGMTLGMQISAINMRLRNAIELLEKYELGSDPVTDQALADSMNVVETYYEALRDVMGLDMMT